MANDTSDLVLTHIEQSIDIAAPPEVVWGLVSDLPRLAEWSPQVVKSFLRGGRPVKKGTRLLNLNRKGLLLWPTRSRVVRCEEGREIAWKIAENGTTWSFTLEPTPGGTRVVQRREALDGISALSIRLTDRFLGGQASFQAELHAGMQQTLEQVKQVAEA